MIGGCSFYWGIEDKFASTKAFNEAFSKMYDGKLPTDYGALGYGGVRTVLAAVKNAGSVDTDKVVAALEALKYDFYKGPQYYRKCDHQSVQSVLVIKSKSKEHAQRFRCVRDHQHRRAQRDEPAQLRGTRP